MKNLRPSPHGPMILALAISLFVSMAHPAPAAETAAPDWTAVQRGLDRFLGTEFGQMLTSIVWRGADMSRTSGWFRPSQSRYTWKTFAARWDTDKDGKVTARELNAPEALFARLDRDRDGFVTAGDLDWDSSSMATRRFMMQFMPAVEAFYGIDRDNNGKVNRAEWDRLFNQLAKEKDFLTPEDLMDLLSPPRPPAPSRPVARGPAGPSRWVLLQGLLSGEIGSPHEGPALGAPGPGFRLPRVDGSKEIALEESRGKPTVLIFGSFT